MSTKPATVDSGKVSTAVKQQFPVWKIIELGTHETVESIKAAIMESGYELSDDADEIMSKPEFCLSKTPSKIKLGRATFSELGFEDGATFQELRARILELGHKPCPPEVGPQLRLQYHEQPKDETLFILMEPIDQSHGCPKTFYVEHDYDEDYDEDYELSLNTHFCYDDHKFMRNCTWVFVICEE